MVSDNPERMEDSLRRAKEGLSYKATQRLLNIVYSHHYLSQLPMLDYQHFPGMILFLFSCKLVFFTVGGKEICGEERTMYS